WSSVSESDGWRPCLEDWIGAGAIAHALHAMGMELSVEARSAVAAYAEVSETIQDVILQSLAVGNSSQKGLGTTSCSPQRSIVMTLQFVNRHTDRGNFASQGDGCDFATAGS